MLSIKSNFKVLYIIPNSRTQQPFSMTPKTKEQESQKKHKHIAGERTHSNSSENTKSDSAIKTHDFASNERRVLREQDLSRKASACPHPVMPGRIFGDVPLSEEPDEMELDIGKPVKTMAKSYRDDREVGRMSSASDYAKPGSTGGRPRVRREKSFVRRRPEYLKDVIPGCGTDSGMRSEGVHEGVAKEASSTKGRNKGARNSDKGEKEA